MRLDPRNDAEAAPDAAPAGLHRRLHVALLAAVIGAGLALRLLALFALPDFFGPGDPATYYTMASSSLHQGVPRVGFVWQYGSLPSEVEHVEDYYEPAFGYLLAGSLAALGERPFSARLLLTLLGAALPLLVYAGTRRFGAGTALIAAAIVALEPWSIYYSAALMKEAAVAVVLVAAAWAARRALASPPGSRRAGVVLGGVVLAASLFQYELLPILGVACTAALAIHRRDLLSGFVVTAAAGTLALGLVSWMWLGVPLSAKFAFFSGRHLWSPLAPHRGSIARFLPVGYVLGMVLMRFYPALLAMVWIGARDAQWTNRERTWTLALVLAFLYFHGVPHDLWERDFIPLVAVLAPFAAVSLARPALWREAPGHAAAALGLIAGSWFGPHSAFQLHVGGVFPVRWMPWTVIAFSLVLIGLFTDLFRRLRRAPIPRRMHAALPVALAAVLLAGYARSLPWAGIVDNPQFPGFHQRIVSWMHASERLRQRHPVAVVMTSSPSEVALFSGLRTVLMPVKQNPKAVALVVGRYRPDLVFVRAGELSPALVAALGLRPEERFLGYEVWRVN